MKTALKLTTACLISAFASANLADNGMPTTPSYDDAASFFIYNGLMHKGCVVTTTLQGANQQTKNRQLYYQIISKPEAITADAAYEQQTGFTIPLKRHQKTAFVLGWSTNLTDNFNTVFQITCDQNKLNSSFSFNPNSGLSNTSNADKSPYRIAAHTLGQSGNIHILNICDKLDYKCIRIDKHTPWRKVPTPPSKPSSDQQNNNGGESA